jgi:hypothetical protein
MYDDITDNIEQLEIYNAQLKEFINSYRLKFIDLLEEKKRIELVLKTYGKE